MALDVRLVHPSNFIFCAPTFAGKTTAVVQLLCRAREFFNPVPDSVHYCFHDEQEIFQKLKEECPLPITFQKGFDRATYEALPSNCILVLDDLHHVTPISLLTDIVIRGTHHSKISLITILHNLFEKGTRTLSLNNQYYFLFRGCRDVGQIKNLGVQLNVGSRFMSEIYADSTRELYDFLFVDARATTPNELRFRSNIFKFPVSVYLPKNVAVGNK